MNSAQLNIADTNKELASKNNTDVLVLVVTVCVQLSVMFKIQRMRK